MTIRDLKGQESAINNKVKFKFLTLFYQQVDLFSKWVNDRLKILISILFYVYLLK